MQALATTTDLYRFGISQEALGDITVEDQDAALLAASSLAAGYLRKRYKFPLVAWADDLREVVAKIAAYNLAMLRGMTPGEDDFKAFNTRYKEAIEWLKGVRTDDIDPEITQTAPVIRAPVAFVRSRPRRGWGE